MYMRTLMSAAAMSLLSFGACALVASDPAAAAGHNFECASATGKWQVVTFKGCGRDTGGESKSFDTDVSSGWVDWVNGDATFLDDITENPDAPGHDCGRSLGVGFSATVTQDDTGSLKVPGQVTMVLCENREGHTWAVSIKFR